MDANSERLLKLAMAKATADLTGHVGEKDARQVALIAVGAAAPYLRAEHTWRLSGARTPHMLALLGISVATLALDVVVLGAVAAGRANRGGMRALGITTLGGHAVAAVASAYLRRRIKAAARTALETAAGVPAVDKT